LKVSTLLKWNLLIGVLSLVGLYLLDYPFELVPTAGIAWVLISTVDSLRILRKKV